MSYSAMMISLAGGENVKYLLNLVTLMTSIGQTRIGKETL